MGYALDQLGPERCREIAETLFKVNRQYGEKLNGCCPIHGEDNPSFVYHFGEDWYKCRSCQAGGDLVKLWCEVSGLDSHGAGFAAFRREFVGDVPVGRIVAPKKAAFAEPTEVFFDEALFSALNPLPVSRIHELRRDRGWSREIIDSIGLREFDAGRGVKKIAIPIRDDSGRLANVRLYQPGAEQYKCISWHDPVCHACGSAWGRDGKKKTCSACGAQPNDYGRIRLFPSPAKWKRDGLLWVCEGEPDTICALSHGLNAVTQTAGCGSWRDEFSAAMGGRDVVIAYDADRPGWDGARKCAESLVRHAKSVRILKWPELMAA